MWLWECHTSYTMFSPWHMRIWWRELLEYPTIDSVFHLFYRLPSLTKIPRNGGHTLDVLRHMSYALGRPGNISWDLIHRMNNNYNLLGPSGKWSFYFRWTNYDKFDHDLTWRRRWGKQPQHSRTVQVRELIKKKKKQNLIYIYTHTYIVLYVF